MSELQLRLDWLTGVVSVAVVLAYFQLKSARRWQRPVVLRLGCLTGLLLLLAALDPRWPKDPGHRSFLVVLFDSSDSVQRADDSWLNVRTEVARWLQPRVEALTPGSGHQARLVAFGRQLNRGTRDFPLAELPERVKSLTQIPPSDGSHLASGLSAAAEILDGKAGLGAVLLISDGHTTDGREAEALAIARRLGRSGIPIHVLPIGGQRPKLGLFAADLPQHLEVDQPASLRAVLTHQEDRLQRLSARLMIDGVPQPSEILELPAESEWNATAFPYRCQEVGLHSIDLEVFEPSTAGPEETPEPSAEWLARQRFITHCVGPAKILVVGYDRRLVAALPPDRFEVEELDPDQLADGPDPGRFDVVILNGVRAEPSRRPWLDRLAAAVERGTGLWVINGRHHGGPEAATVLMSYDKLPLADTLPVITGQRALEEVTPPLDIFLLIDISSSMNGWELTKAKEIADTLIDRLRPVDKLSLIAFNHQAFRTVWQQPMTSQARQDAKTRVSALKAYGGTDPEQALRQLDKLRNLRNCGLFIVSDGEFGWVRPRPGCEGTVFAIARRTSPELARLAATAEPIEVPNTSFNPREVGLRFFQPEPRDRFFEPGTFEPMLGIDAYDRRWPALPPELIPFNGSAVTHPRHDAEEMIDRPRPNDPVLAYRNHGWGRVAALTTALPEGYLRAGSRETVRRWIEELIAYRDRDRFSLSVTPLKDGYRLRYVLLDRGGDLPSLRAVQATLAVGDDVTQVELEPVPELPGVFSAELNPPPVPTATEAYLVLREIGNGALPRPQGMPWTLTPIAADLVTGSGDEDWHFGIHHEHLRALADATGGVYQPTEDDLLSYGARPATTASRAPALICFALLVYLGQIAIRNLGKRR